MLRPGHAVALCVIALLTIGVVMVNSAGMSIDPKHAITLESILLSRSTFYMAAAMLALAVAAFLPIRRIAAAISTPPPFPRLPDRATLPETLLGLRYMWAAVALLLALLACVYLPVIGREVNGSHRWVALTPGKKGFTLQPSEFAKWGVVALLAWYGATRTRALPTFTRGLCPALVALGLIAGFVVLEDLGTGFLIACVGCVILLAAGARLWHFGLFAPLGALGLVAAILTSEYRVKRLTSFLDPYKDPEGIGYHMIQSMVAVANGERFGRGLGHGLQKFGYLPEDQTDFLFAIICEELGIAGAALVIALYLTMLWSGWVIVRRESDRFLKLLGIGVLATVGFQAVINLAVVTGLGPTKGIALPLLSSGGTGWILTAASLGLIVAIDRAQARRFTPTSHAEPGEVVVTAKARQWLSGGTGGTGVPPVHA
ncbi:MAG: cell division protein FtsW [Phycisphaerales bacterium]|nr:cell division protein FtsW [Phycisphaerales bacterium]